MVGDLFVSAGEKCEYGDNSEEEFQMCDYAPLSFTAILIQRVVSVSHGCLGVAAIGQRVVNALPQCVPPPNIEACGSSYWEPSCASGSP